MADTISKSGNPDDIILLLIPRPHQPIHEKFKINALPYIMRWFSK